MPEQSLPQDRNAGIAQDEEPYRPDEAKVGEEGGIGSEGVGRSRSSRRRLREDVLGLPVVAAVVTAVGLVLAWPLLNGRTTSVVPTFQTATYPWAAFPRGLSFLWPQSDSAESTFPWSALAQRSWREGHLPLWDQLSFGGGVPLANDGVSATLYPVRALLDAALPLWLAHEAFVVVHLLAAVLAAYWLARRWGAGRGGALVAGLGWGLNAYVLAWSQLEMVTPFFVALPLVLAAGDRALRERSRGAILVGALSVCFALIAGNIAYAVIAVVTLALYLGVLIVVRAVRDRSRLVGDVLTSLAVGLGGLALSAFVLAPTLITLSSVSRQPFTWEQLTSNLMVDFSVYTRVFEWPDPPRSAVDMNNMLYVTPVLMVLAVVGVASRARRARYAGAWALVLVPVLVASVVPAAWVAYHFFPGFDAIQPYSRVLPISLLAICLLAAIGADMLLRGVRRHAPAAVGGVVVVALAVAVALPSILLGRSVNPPAISSADHPQYPVTPAIRAMLERGDEAGWPARVMPVSVTLGSGAGTTGLALIGGSALAPGVDTWGGYASAVPQRTSELSRMVAGEPVRDVLGTMGEGVVAHPVYTTKPMNWGLLCRAGTDMVFAGPPVADQREKWGSLPEDLRAFGYDGPDGRIVDLPAGCSSAPYLSGGSVVGDSPVEMVEELQRQGSAVLRDRDREREVVVPRGLGGRADEGATGSVVEADRSGADLRVSVETDGPMWLVLPVSYDPGWRATVDGESVETHQVDFNRVGVVVDGDSEVELHLRPVGMRAGTVLTAATVVLGGLALLFWPRLGEFVRRRRRSGTAV
jgi:uncharacterized protein YqgC (DUF456 family)